MFHFQPRLRPGFFCAEDPFAAIDAGLIVEACAFDEIASNGWKSCSMKPERSMPGSVRGLLAVAGVLFLAAVAWLAAWRSLHGSDPEMQRLMARLDVVDKAKDEENARTSGESPRGRVPMDAIFGQSDADPDSALDRLETEFSREPDDPSSSDLERRLRNITGDKRLRASGIVPEGVDVKCRRDMCRVVANFHEVGEAADWTALYVTFIGTDAVPAHRTIFVENADGGTQARLFATRGERAPR